MPGRTGPVSAPVEAEPHDDAEYPRLERGVSAKPAQGVAYLDEGVLDHFLGVLAVIEYLVGEAVGQRVKLNHQRPKVIPASLDDAVHPAPLRRRGRLDWASSRAL